MIQPREAHQGHSFSASQDNYDEHQIENSANFSQHRMSGLSTSTSNAATQENALHSGQSSSQSFERQDLASEESIKKNALAVTHNYDPF